MNDLLRVHVFQFLIPLSQVSLVHSFSHHLIISVPDIQFHIIQILTSESHVILICLFKRSCFKLKFSHVRVVVKHIHQRKKLSVKISDFSMHDFRIKVLWVEHKRVEDFVKISVHLGIIYYLDIFILLGLFLWFFVCYFWNWRFSNGFKNVFLLLVCCWSYFL